MQVAHEQVARKIRNKIKKGEWQPGSRLPNRPSIISDVGSNAKVVQSAIHQLVDEGFLEVGARKMGTRVVSNPPHLSRYYLILPYGPNSWDHFWRALVEAVEDLSGDDCDITCFYGLGGQRDIADYQQMIADVKNKSVAGLIFASSGDEFAGTPLLDTPGIPRVAITSHWALPGIPKIHLDIDGFVSRAVAHLAEQGRKKLAILSPNPETAETFRQSLAEHGLDCNSGCIQYPRRSLKDSARCAVDLMMQLQPANRPDSLIIADDNMIEGSVETLTSSGIKVPEELALVTMNNFPHIVQSQLPVTRLGFDIPALLGLLMKQLREVSEGRDIPENTNLSVISETEFNHTNMKKAPSLNMYP